MIIDGREIANKILDEVKRGAFKLGFKPVLCDVLVGSDPVALSYVNIKGKTAERVGLEFLFSSFPESISESDLVAEIKLIQAKKRISGIIVQLPLPAHLNRQAVLDSILPELDVDAIGSVNKQFFFGEPQVHIVPPTARAVLEILKSTGVNLENKKIVICLPN